MADDPTGDPPPDDGSYPLPYRASDRMMAGLLLVGCVLLGFISLDVLTGGALTRRIGGGSDE